MENENKEDVKNIDERLIKTTEKAIDEILRSGLQTGNISLLTQLVDIRKDVKEAKNMRYENYGNYDLYGRRMRDSRGRFMNDNLSRRGVDSKYRGHEMLDDVYENYGRYSESNESYNRGNYGAKNDMMQSLEYMLESVVDFIGKLKTDANSQEEIDMIQKYTRKISEM